MDSGRSESWEWKMKFGMMELGLIIHNNIKALNVSIPE